MASAYKWRITNTKYAYITDENGGDPFIGVNISSEVESKISLKANQLNEENYSFKYNSMVEKIKDDPDGKSMDLPDYRYYYNIDSTSNCATINYGIQGAQGANGVGISNILQTKSSDGVNTITFVLTDGSKYNIYINDGATGSDGLTGPTGEQGRNGEDAVPSEDSVRRIVNEMDIVGAVTASLESSLGEQYDDLLGKYNKLVENYELLLSYLSAATVTANEALNKAGGNEKTLEGVNSNIGSLESTLSEHTSSISILSNTSDSLKNSLATAVANVATLSGVSGNISLEFDEIKDLVNVNIGRQVLLSGFVESINLRLSGFSENILENRGNIIALSGATNGIDRRVGTCEANYTTTTKTIDEIKTNYNSLSNRVTSVSGVTSSAMTSIDYLFKNVPTTNEINTVISEITQPEFSNLNGKISDNRNSIETLNDIYDKLYVRVEKVITPNLNALINAVDELSDNVKTLSGLTRQSGTTS